MEASVQSKFPTVVIAGAGFGGLEVAKNLADQPVEVIMLDKHNYHVFQPLLYQVATGSLESESIAFSIRKNFSKQKNFKFRIAKYWVLIRILIRWILPLAILNMITW
jgi:NADH dehydrogenase